MKDAATSRERPLGEVVEIFTGVPTSRAGKSGEGRTYRLINTRNLDDYGQLSVDGFDHIRLPLGTKIERYQVWPGDVLLVCRGASLRTALVNGAASGAIASSNLLILRPRDEKVLSQALVAWLRTPRGQYELSSRRRSSTAVLLLRVKDVAEIPFPLPPLTVQRQIADLIECADTGYRAGVRAAELRRRAGYEVAAKMFSSETAT